MDRKGYKANQWAKEAMVQEKWLTRVNANVAALVIEIPKEKIWCKKKP